MKVLGNILFFVGAVIIGMLIVVAIWYFTGELVIHHSDGLTIFGQKLYAEYTTVSLFGNEIFRF